MAEADATECVRLLIRGTPLRYALAAFFFLPAVATLATFALIGLVPGDGSVEWGLLFVALIPRLAIVVCFVWLACQLIRVRMTIRIDGHSVVTQTRGLIGPSRTSRIDLRRAKGHSFETRTYPRDAIDPTFRPAFRARVLLPGDGGSPIAQFPGLTADEGALACAALNRLLETASGAARLSSSGGTSNKRIEPMA